MTSEKTFTIKSIGTIHTSFPEAKGAPVQPAAAKNAEGRIEIFNQYLPGLKDLEDFERIWILYWFDRACDTKLTVKPYLDDQEHGVFATRAPCRPNPIGISCIQLNQIEKNILFVSDVDMLDQTPLLDIKPYAPKFDHFEVTRFGWLQDKTIENKTADDRFYKG